MGLAGTSLDSSRCHLLALALDRTGGEQSSLQATACSACRSSFCYKLCSIVQLEHCGDSLVPRLSYLDTQACHFPCLLYSPLWLIILHNPYLQILFCISHYEVVVGSFYPKLCLETLIFDYASLDPTPVGY